jgi:hypothetical protein
VILLAACSSTTTPAANDAAPAPRAAQNASATLVPQEPEQGKAMVVGRLLSSQTQTALAQTAVRLAEVHRQGEEGAYVLDGANSPGAITNDQGEFVIPNIDPKEYVIVAGDVYAANDVVKEPTGKPKAWSINTDQVLNVGDVQVNLAP